MDLYNPISQRSPCFIYLFVCFKQRVYFPLPLRWGSLLTEEECPRAAASGTWLLLALPAAPSTAHSSPRCTVLLHRPLATFSFFLKWTETGGNVTSASQTDVSFVIMKKYFFGDLGHLYICELCFPVFYSLFVWISFFHFINFLKNFLFCIGI